MNVARVAAAILIVAVAGCTIVEKPAPPMANAFASVPFEVGGPQPLVVHALRFEAKPGPKVLREIELYGATAPTEGAGFTADVWTSFVDVRTGRLPGPVPWANVTFGGPRYDGVCPATGCDVTWLVVSRAMESLGGATRTGQLHGGLTARARDDPRPSEPPFALDVLRVTEVDPPATPVLLASASVTGSIRLEPGDPLIRRTVRISIDPSIVALPREFPQIGRVAYFGSAALGDRPSSIRADVVLAGAVGADVAEGRLGGIYTPAADEIDLLSLCPTKGRCAIDVAMSWSLSSTDTRRSAALDHGTATDWRLEVRFEGPAGTVVPAGAVTIGDVPTP